MLSTSGSTDPDGDVIRYVWERRVDNGGYVQLGYTTVTYYTDTVPAGSTSYQARVKAVDSWDDESVYTVGSQLSVNNNNPPSITLVTTSLGEKRDSFDVQFKVNDPDAGDILGVVVTNDGTEIMRKQNAARNTTYTATLTRDAWQRAAGGNHKIVITVEDGKVATERTLQWKKTIEGIDMSTEGSPVQCDDMPKRLLLLPDVSLISGAVQQYFACNNGMDESTDHAWEDITDAVLAGTAYTFTNQTKTAAKWGVCAWAIIKKPNGATEKVKLRRLDGTISL